MLNEERLWGVGDVASYLRMPISSIYKMTAPKARNRLPHFKLEGRLRFARVDIDAWLARHRVSNLEALERAEEKVKYGNRRAAS